MIMGIKYLTHSAALKISSIQTGSATADNAKNSLESPIQRRQKEQQELLEVDKREFHKRYYKKFLYLYLPFLAN